MSDFEELREAMMRPKNNRIVSVISYDQNEQEMILDCIVAKAGITFPLISVAMATDGCADESPR